MSNETKVIDCNCNHEYQDGRYGKGKRLANPTKTKDGKQRHRCTVCRKLTE